MGGFAQKPHDFSRGGVFTKPFWYSLRWWIVVALAVVAATAFLPALNNGFLAFDDDENFLDNASFRGLGPSQIRWAWTTFLLGVYQPLAWMLLELEYVLAGLNPRGYHLVSIGLHAAVAVALFALIVAILRRCGWPANQAPGARFICSLPPRWPLPCSRFIPCGSRWSPGHRASPTCPAHCFRSSRSLLTFGRMTSLPMPTAGVAGPG